MLNAATLDHAWIERHIPHKGGMCVLDRVVTWDEQHIHCRATNHRDPGNPLRAGGRLGAVCGIEYAAQAMAVHGALLAPPAEAPARAGYLVSVRGVQVHAGRLDNIAGALEITATCLMRGDNNILYEFSLDGDGHVLVQGRAAVMVDAGGAAFITGTPA